MRLGNLFLQRANEMFRQDRYAIFGALALANDDLATLDFDVLHPKPQTLEQPQAASVEHRGDQPYRAVKLVKQRLRLANRQDDRQASRELRLHDFIEPRQRFSQHLLVEKEQGGLGLI